MLAGAALQGRVCFHSPMHRRNHPRNTSSRDRAFLPSIHIPRSLAWTHEASWRPARASRTFRPRPIVEDVERHRIPQRPTSCRVASCIFHRIVEEPIRLGYPTACHPDIGGTESRPLRRYSGPELPPGCCSRSLPAPQLHPAAQQDSEPESIARRWSSAHALFCVAGVSHRSWRTPCGGAV